MNDGPPDALSRRRALAALGAGVAVLPACTPERSPSSSSEVHPMASTSPRMPVVYLPHGGGPWPFVDLGLGDRAELDGMASYLRGLASLPPQKPKALLVISAHWEEAVPTVMTAERPPMLYDYYGFPPESYTITWPAPGHPELAQRVRGLLEGAGFHTAADPARGFDHGTFVPLKLTYPQADVPTVQLSLKRGLDPAEHVAMGRALAPLRDEGVFIVGSGMSYHNLRGFFAGSSAGREASEAFDAWLGEAVAQDPDERARRLAAWSRAPSARAAHPREEHLLPLMVIAGAAGQDRANRAYHGSLVGYRISGFHFG